MSSLQEIKRRIKSVDNTKKITKAMQLVATTKLKRSKSALAETQLFYHNVYEVVNKLFNQVDDLDFLKVKNAKSSTLFVVISSSVGLCGAYNQNTNKLLLQNFKENDYIIAVGTKVASFLKAKNHLKNILHVYDLSDELMDYDLCSEIGATVYKMYLNGECNRVEVIYTEFISSISFNAKVLQLFPIEKNKLNLLEKKLDAVTEFEPSAEKVITDVIPLYFNAVLFGALTESKVSEHASRRNAMEAATKSAQEIKDKLSLVFNRARQANITQELSEIISGANAS